MRGVDLARGAVLLIAGVLVVTLQAVLPYAAPLALVGYGAFLATRREFGEAIMACLLAVVVFVVAWVVAWLLWGLGILIAAMGMFWLVVGMTRRRKA
ncbi:MAG TPA: hypothetical protein VL359_05150 [bacterium]|nr:hypothetical protein [bacterium]